MNVSQEEIEFYQKQFNECDTDGDGFITLDEICAGCPEIFSEVNDDLTILERILADADFNKDNRFSFDEYIVIMEMIMRQVQIQGAS